MCTHTYTLCRGCSALLCVCVIWMCAYGNLCVCKCCAYLHPPHSSLYNIVPTHTHIVVQTYLDGGTACSAFTLRVFSQMLAPRGVGNTIKYYHIHYVSVRARVLCTTYMDYANTILYMLVSARDVCDGVLHRGKCVLLRLLNVRVKFHALSPFVYFCVRRAARIHLNDNLSWREMRNNHRYR